MHTLSSASRTCMASESAVECTATVWMPISLQARRMRSATSPRLAMSTFSNMAWGCAAKALFDDHEHGAVLDRSAVLDQDLRYSARARCRERVHHLHRLEDEECVPRLDLLAHLDEMCRPRLGQEVDRAHHGREHRTRMAGIVDRVHACRGGCRGGGGRCRRASRCCGRHMARDADAPMVEIGRAS